jgi:hypothetical protein
LQIFEASPRLIRAKQHHEFLREEESKTNEQRALVRPKTAPKSMMGSSPKLTAKAAKSLIDVQNENESCLDAVDIAVLSAPN